MSTNFRTNLTNLKYTQLTAKGVEAFLKEALKSDVVNMKSYIEEANEAISEGNTYIEIPATKTKSGRPECFYFGEGEVQ